MINKYCPAHCSFQIPITLLTHFSPAVSLLSSNYTTAEMNPSNPASRPSTFPATVEIPGSAIPWQSAEEEAAASLLMLAEAVGFEEEFDMADEEDHAVQSPVSSAGSSNNIKVKYMYTPYFCAGSYFPRSGHICWLICLFGWPEFKFYSPCLPVRRPCT